MFVQLQLAAQNSGAQQCTTRGPSSTTRNPTVPCGGNSQHPHTPHTPTTAYNNPRALAGHHARHTQNSPPSLPSSPTLPPGSIHYPHLPTGACSSAPRAATPCQQVTSTFLLRFTCSRSVKTSPYLADCILMFSI